MIKLMKRPASISTPGADPCGSAPRSPCAPPSSYPPSPARPEEEFQMLLDFIDKAESGQGWLLQISPVRGAKANELPGSVPAEVQEERFQPMELQQQVSIRKAGP